MNKEFIEKIENKVNSINILDKDPFVKESCKNIYRALLVVVENENPSIDNIFNVLSDTNKTIELLKKFDSINKEKYNGDLSYIVVDVNNNQTLLYLIELLKHSMNITTDSNSINKSTDLNTIIDKFLKNEISATEIEEDINVNKIKFSVSSSKEYGEITRPLNKKYYEIFGKGITFYEDKSYPSREKCFISLLKAIENKKEVEYYYNEYLQGNNNDNNNKKGINIDDINIILNSILTTSTFLKIENIKNIQFLPSKQGYTIEVSDGNRKLYMGVSEYGYVEIVRENSINGKIVYMPDDDSYIKSFEENKINEELNFSSREEAVNAYMKKFGGFPFMSLRGLPDNIIIEKVKTALKNNTEISIDFDDQTDSLNGNIINKNEFIESSQNKIMKVLENNKIMEVLENMNNSKMVNTQLETYFESLMETQDNVEDEYLSLPIINMIDKSNIKLRSSIISFYTQDNKKFYYCQGYIDKNYDIKTLPNCKLFDKVELIKAEISMLSVIPKGEYSNSTTAELKEKYYSLLDKIKELVVKDPDSLTSDESIIILDYLKLYRYLEKEEVQAYQSLKSDFLIWCLGCSNVSNNQKK